MRKTRHKKTIATRHSLALPYAADVAKNIIRLS